MRCPVGLTKCAPTTQPWNRPLHAALTVPWWTGQYVRSRDCWANWTIGYWKDGCLDGAIQNYTQRLANVSLEYEQRVEALKYIVHFIGDLHQPLHGGFWTDYSGDTTYGYWFGPSGYGPPTPRVTLHTIWDRGLIYKRFEDDYGGDEYAWEKSVAGNASRYAGSFEQWTTCPASSTSPLVYGACPDVWLSESNLLCMAVVYRYNATGPVFNYTTGFNITADTGYYQWALPTVELQLIKAGVRMANVLNHILGQMTPPPAADGDDSGSSSLAIIAGVVVALLVVVCAAALVWYGRWKGWWCAGGSAADDEGGVAYVTSASDGRDSRSSRKGGRDELSRTLL